MATGSAIFGLGDPSITFIIYFRFALLYTFFFIFFMSSYQYHYSPNKSYSYFRTGECTMGDLMTDAIQWWVHQTHPDVSCSAVILNGGSIRANIPAGPISMRSIIAAHPFPDSVAVVQLQGSDLVSVLQQSLTALGGINTGLFLQLNGLKISFNRDRPAGLRLISALIADPLVGWSDINPSRYYPICMNSWLRNGGDGYTVIPQQGVEFRDYPSLLSDGKRCIQIVRILTSISFKAIYFKQLTADQYYASGSHHSHVRNCL
jgi:2',3'-cyclic-nucleotide 2'-phosphodiesterase (5'-nucleotidase family)